MRSTQATGGRRRPGSTIRRKLLAVAIAQAVMGLTAPAGGATITVDDMGDVSGANCTLRDAIVSANTDAAVAGCGAGSGVDLIEFAPSASPVTITIQPAQIQITSPLTIQGPGADRLTISGNNETRIFQIDDFGPFRIIQVALAGMTLTGGNAGAAPGGAISNRENLEIRDSTLSGNSAAEGGGIYNAATVALNNSKLNFNTAANLGGGIRNRGVDNAATVTVTASTISGNSAMFGGGLSNYGATATVTGSTISANTAAQGGGLYNEASSVAVYETTISGNTANLGAGAANYQGTLTITGSTISGNTANGRGGGIYHKKGPFSLNSSTISGNTADGRGGGIYGNDGAITVTSSTISGNSANSGGGLYSNSLVTVGLTNSIIANSAGGGDCANAGALAMNVNNLTGDASCDPEFSGDPKLGPLADNGGPTRTHRPMPGSLAIDNGDAANCPDLDQRGFQRPVDGNNDGTAACDIGSVEFKSNPHIFRSGFETLEDP